MHVVMKRACGTDDFPQWFVDEKPKAELMRWKIRGTVCICKNDMISGGRRHNAGERKTIF